MLPCPGYYKQCCNEHWGTHVSFDSGFLSMYAQQWDCWIIRQFYFKCIILPLVLAVIHTQTCNLMLCNKVHLQYRRPWFNSWVRKIPWRRDRLPTPVFLGFPGDSDGKESNEMWVTWVQSLGGEDPLKEGMATHSSILAWRIPMDGEKPGRLQSMGSQRVRQN